MNATTSRRLRDIAKKIHPAGSGEVRHRGTKIVRVYPGPGMPGVDLPVAWETVQRTGRRSVYQNLKRQLKATPRDQRGAFLEGLESFNTKRPGA